MVKLIFFQWITWSYRKLRQVTKCNETVAVLSESLAMCQLFEVTDTKEMHTPHILFMRSYAQLGPS